MESCAFPYSSRSMPSCVTLTYTVLTPLFSALCFLLCLLFPSPVFSGPVYSDSIRINFTATYQRFIDNSGAGAFLASQNNTFQARITNVKQEKTSFYFVVVHVRSNEIVWSANRDQPVTGSSQLQFTEEGLALYNESGDSIWSTPLNVSSSTFLKLLESGNLILLDANNNTLWESFASPTDVLLEGQKLRLGKSLVSSESDEDLSQGSYKFLIGVDDATLQWNGMDYWKLFMYRPAYRDSLLPVEYMMMNASGIFLLANNGQRIVVRAPLSNSNDFSGNASIFRMAKLDSRGAFNIIRVNLGDGSLPTTEFTGPDDNCRIPLKCGRLGLCTDKGSCQCAPGFHYDVKGDCVPVDTSLALPGPCNGSSGGADIRYFKLTGDLAYFSYGFTDPIADNFNLSACQNLCSRNCSCLGVSHSQGLGSCYMIWNYLGSFTIKPYTNDRVAYVKMVVAQIPTADLGSKKSNFSVLVVVLLASSGAIATIALVVALVCLRRKRRMKPMYFVSSPCHFTHFPGLPVMFKYNELVAATKDFRTELGSGGFGTVYKGSLVNGTDVAVKKITCLGAEAKREFQTEIAAIGIIRHTNLVNLKGFCAHRGQRFLVYEYMNQGSLDRKLFHEEPVLNWDERFKIALGTAKGLDYLHSSCERKIIHCDVKPENILLHDNLHVKISDFGLSKLLTQDQSGIFTLMRGTRGYIAPEWLMMNTAISEKTDVYSYGMVLLEIISGKKNFFLKANHSNSGIALERQVNFPLYALEMHIERRYQDLVDPRLRGQVPFWKCRLRLLTRSLSISITLPFKSIALSASFEKLLQPRLRFSSSSLSRFLPLAKNGKRDRDGDEQRRRGCRNFLERQTSSFASICLYLHNSSAQIHRSLALH